MRHHQSRLLALTAKWAEAGLSICRSIMKAQGGWLSASGNEGPVRHFNFQFVPPSHQEDAS
jgi:hypothetical protein